MAMYFDIDSKYNVKDKDFTRLSVDFNTEKIRLDFNASKVLKTDTGYLVGMNVTSCTGLRFKADPTFPILLSVMFQNKPYELSRYNADTKKSEKYTQEPTGLDLVMIKYFDELPVDSEANYTGYIDLETNQFLPMVLDGTIPMAKFTQCSFAVSPDDKSPLADKVLSPSDGTGNGKNYAPAEKQADKIKARLTALIQLTKDDLQLPDNDQTIGTLAVNLNSYFVGIGVKQPQPVDEIYLQLLNAILA